MRELLEHTGPDLPRMNRAALLPGLFSADLMDLALIEQQQPLTWAVLPTSEASSRNVDDVIADLHAYDLPAHAQIITKLHTLTRQTNLRLSLLMAQPTSLPEFIPHPDMTPQPSMRFTIVESGGIEYLLNGNPQPQPAIVGDVMALDNTSAFPDTRPRHGGQNGTGTRLIITFSAAQ